MPPFVKARPTEVGEWATSTWNYAGTRPLSEAKRVRDTIVLPWVIRLEGVLLILFLGFCCLKGP